MDFIQQAIDKAREQRQQPDNNQKESVATPVRTAGPSPQKIEYTHTRVVQLNAEHLRRQRIIAANHDDKRTESYRQLRTQILRKLRENSWRTLAVTSPNSKAGKSLTALNLAISLSLEVNQTVMLVDLDLRSSSLLQKLGVDAEYGLIDVLEGRVELNQALINPGFERLVVLPNGAQNHRSELLSSPQMGKLLSDIVNRYQDRLIIFDLPALLDDDDALVFAPYADALLLVVEDGVSKRSELERCKQLLEGTQLIGTVLNKVR
jgi:capsular exopolysaccharide synthesis family protein